MSFRTGTRANARRGYDLRTAQVVGAVCKEWFVSGQRPFDFAQGRLSGLPDRNMKQPPLGAGVERSRFGKTSGAKAHQIFYE